MDQALGAVLAAPLCAAGDLPGADVSAMDGFAVRGAGPWEVVGQVLAGDPPAAPLADGQAVEIATGAPVPAGCDGVLPVEQADAGPPLRGQPPAGRHVRRRGEEVAAGEQLLPAGARVTPLVQGLAAAAGLDRLPVSPLPQVALLVTGDELVRSGVPEPGRTRDAVGPLLPGLLAAYGGRVVAVSWLPDRRAELVEAVRTAAADVVVTSGASSRGPADHLLPALRALDAEVLVDGVDVRPGHPQVLARLVDGRWVVGLPGNPLAAVCGAVTLLAPLLAALGGGRAPEPVPARWSAAAEGALPEVRSTRLVPVRVTPAGLEPTAYAGAAMLRGAATSDGLAVVAPDRDQPALLAWPW